jgi:hypothetical protein
VALTLSLLVLAGVGGGWQWKLTSAHAAEDTGTQPLGWTWGDGE